MERWKFPWNSSFATQNSEVMIKSPFCCAGNKNQRSLLETWHCQDKASTGHGNHLVNMALAQHRQGTQYKQDDRTHDPRCVVSGKVSWMLGGLGLLVLTYILDQWCDVLPTKDSLVLVADSTRGNQGQERGVQDLEGKKSKRIEIFPSRWEEEYLPLSTVSFSHSWNI